MTIKRPLIVGEIVEDFRSAYNATVSKVEEIIDDIKDEFKSTDVVALAETIVAPETVEPLIDEPKKEEIVLSKDVNTPEEVKA